MGRYCVSIVFDGKDNFVVEDPKITTPEQAADEAWRRFKAGAEPTPCGNEWQEPRFIAGVEDLDGAVPCTLDPNKLKEPGILGPDCGPQHVEESS